MKQIHVSVIVTTRNEEENIANCIRSVGEQSYLQDMLEIIVVDNHSADRTTELAREYTNQVYVYGHNRAAQLNYGAGKARGRYIIFPDADMILSNRVIEECVEKCNKEGFVALYIPERIIGRGLWIKARDFERGFYDATCIDCVRFVRREAFFQIGGFDESLQFGPDDWDFDRRIKEKGEVGIIDAPLYHNEGSFNLRRYLLKKGDYSRSFAAYVGKWGADDEIVNKQLGFWYRYVGVFTEKGKWVRLLRHPVLASAVLYLRFMVGLHYVMNKGKSV